MLSSETSGRMYETDDIVLDDEDLSSIARSNSVDYLKEKAIVMLQQELESAKKELEVKDEKCKELSGVRSKVEAELEELTASLFEEAHKMVHDANMKQFVAEKRLNAAIGEIEALRTEVSALKSLVLTSTPSNPNPQSHPQLIKKKKDLLSSPLRKHRRNRSDADMKPPTPTEDKKDQKIVKMGKEVDSVLMSHLNSWLQVSSFAPPTAVNHVQSNQSGSIDQNIDSGASPTAVNHTKINQSEITSVTNPNSQIDEPHYDTTEYETMAPMMPQLIQRIEAEDIKPCLTFSQSSLADKVLSNVHNNTLMIEPISKPAIQKCALSGAVICCKHRIKCGNSEMWFPISQSCRTRIASVCDFLAYISYIKKGLVKHSKDQIYWEINRLRREMSLAKLGYYKEE
uniref:guanine nucleotide exchange factor for Rab-3A-like n=1 Tax=Styela clava TaxID=7725 RepID=UPI00193A5408|nr:guanine nucleotide exchange factor for Rab-3A-like [Styela clava]